MSHTSATSGVSIVSPELWGRNLPHSSGDTDTWLYSVHQSVELRILLSLFIMFCAVRKTASRDCKTSLVCALRLQTRFADPCSRCDVHGANASDMIVVYSGDQVSKYHIMGDAQETYPFGFTPWLFTVYYSHCLRYLVCAHLDTTQTVRQVRNGLPLSHASS